MPGPGDAIEPELPKRAVGQSTFPGGKKVLLTVGAFLVFWLLVANVLGWQTARGGGERVSLSAILDANERCPGYSDPPPCSVVPVEIGARSNSDLVIVSALQGLTSRWKVETTTRGGGGEKPSVLRLDTGLLASAQPSFPFGGVGVRFRALQPGVGKVTAFYGNCASPDTDMRCPNRTEVTVVVEAR